MPTHSAIAGNRDREPWLLADALSGAGLHERREQVVDVQVTGETLSWPRGLCRDRSRLVNAVPVSDALIREALSLPHALCEDTPQEGGLPDAWTRLACAFED